MDMPGSFNMISYLVCIKTAGEPHAASVYSTIHDNTNKNFQNTEMTSPESILAQ
jgi:hypothetical protein